MNEIYNTLLNSFKVLEIPNTKIILEDRNMDEQEISINIVGEWIHYHESSKTLDFIIDNILMRLDVKIVSKIGYVFIFNNMNEFASKKNVGFRKIGVFH